jgi:Ca-activated chloride channel family protein
MKRIDFNDPRLTAYALGELTGPEHDAIIAIIENDPDAMREVAAIRTLSGRLTEELQAEPCPSLELNERREINQELAGQHDQNRSSVWPQLIPKFAVNFLAMAVMLMLVAVMLKIGWDGAEVNTKLAELDGDLINDRSKTLNEPRVESTGLNSYYGAVPYLPSGSSFGSTTDHIFPKQSPVASDDFVEGGIPVSNAETYIGITDNPFLAVAQNPLSTFSIDVDTASYANMRRFITQHTLPPKDSVRIEELINYFSYDYAPPSVDDDKPFAAYIESAACPWNTGHRLVRIGLKGKVISQEKRPPSNLVFLIDVSGSMAEPNKLPLVQQSMRLLTEQLSENDRVAMVVYAGSSGLVLPSTTGDKKNVIREALDRLQAGGSTHGSAGIQLAYNTAVANFIKGGVNRVILCTDGDFNVGVTSQGDLQRLIEEKAKSGVFLSVLGFGMGNLKDATMETLADKGNGNYGYIDTLNEAKKLFVEQMTGTLITIAKDVKIQVEFNPAQVSAYRLIGYENRLLATEDFNDDTKDAGEIGAGHTVTALYEVVPAGREIATAGVDPLKYQQPVNPVPVPTVSKELLTVKLRYKQPEGDTSKLLEYPFTDQNASFDKASKDFRFASAVAMFGMILRDSPHKGGATIGGVIELAESSLVNDMEGYRQEFVNLAKQTGQLMTVVPANVRR